MLDLSDLTFEKETPVLVVENFNAEMEWNKSHTESAKFKESYKNSSEFFNDIIRSIKADSLIGAPLGMSQSTYGIKDKLDVTGFAWFGKDVARFSVSARYLTDKTISKARCNYITKISFKEKNDIETFKKVMKDLSSITITGITPAKDGIAITLYNPSKEICSKMESKYGTKTKLLNRTFKIPNK